MTTIEELERELEQFHNNIVGSNKLIETINDVIEAIKLHKQDFSVRSEALVKLIESVPVDIDKNNTKTIAEFSQKIISTVEAQQKEIGERSDTEYHILKDVHGNIEKKNSAVVTEFSQRIISTVEAQQKEIGERSNALSKLIEALPGTIEEKNAAAITEFYRQMLEIVSKEHKLYIENIDQYMQALEGMKNGLAAQQEAFIEKLDTATSSFSHECAAQREALSIVKSELSQETTATLHAITAENANICEKYLNQVRTICNETQEGFANYTSKLEQLTAQFMETEKNTREVIANAEKSFDSIVSEAANHYREISDSITKSTERLLLEIKVYIEHLEKQNASLVKNIEEKFINRFKSLQNENAQILKILSEIQSAQKKDTLITGIGFAIVAVLCVLGFFI